MDHCVTYVHCTTTLTTYILKKSTDFVGAAFAVPGAMMRRKNCAICTPLMGAAVKKKNKFKSLTGFLDISVSTAGQLRINAHVL